MFNYKNAENKWLWKVIIWISWNESTHYIIFRLIIDPYKIQIP
jgi:hypothetical protein